MGIKSRLAIHNKLWLCITQNCTNIHFDFFFPKVIYRNVVFYDIHRFYSLFSIDYKSGQFALGCLVRGDSVSGRLELYLANVKKIK